ncbi:MAG: glycosyltransferase family 9 protein [Pseudomonadota bacterium]
MPSHIPQGSATPSVLVVVTRRIGDVLLATPLIRSIKLSWPSAAIDVLVFEGTQGVIAANPDVRRILTIPPRPGLLQHLGFALRLLRRYDIALSLVPGDRPTFYAFIAGKWRAGLLLDTPRERWKRRFLQQWVAFDERNTHTVLMHLALADILGIAPRREVVVSWRQEEGLQVDRLLGTSSAPLAVLHPYPKFNYKMWHMSGWTELVHWLSGRGYRIVLSGGGDAAEISYVTELAARLPAQILNLAGRLTLGAAASLLARAQLYVGPDTALTHMAAALGVPTVAIYGPTDPVKWGPWPKNYAGAGNPWRRLGSQTLAGISLIQGNMPCAPCHQEGCDRHVESYSDCLVALPAARVIAAVEHLIADTTHA